MRLLFGKSILWGKSFFQILTCNTGRVLIGGTQGNKRGSDQTLGILTEARPH